jgi:hypothetical protein
MPDWKQLAAMTPEPSLLDAIAFAEGELTILEYVRYIRNADDFVAHLRTLPDAEAVALVKQAVREGDKRHNQQELFRNRAFTQWMVDMATYIDTFGQTTSDPEILGDLQGDMLYSPVWAPNKREALRFFRKHFGWERLPVGTECGLV